MKEQIIRSETDLLKTAVERIVRSEVLEKEIAAQLPVIEELPDSNKVLSGKVSVLFVDMRESTKLPEKYSPDQLVRIYRSYIRTVVQAIRYSGGVVRDFMGDGILAVFVDDDTNSSEEKSVHAARYIVTSIDKVLNPVLDRELNHRISYGIGIHTGDILLSKVGMRGKEQQDDAEDEFGITWIGNCTNLACKFSSAVSNGAIFISASTYTALTDVCKSEKWKWIDIPKGNNVLSGYIAQHYYLQIDNGVLPCCVESTRGPSGLIDTLKSEYAQQITRISEKSEELGKKQHQLDEKERQLSAKAAEINAKSKDLISKELRLNKDEYRFHVDVIRSAHCQDSYTREMELDFWEDHLKAAIIAGGKIGKDEHTVKQEVSFVMVDIYDTFEIWDKAYDYLVEQATGYAWLTEGVVKKIVQKIGCCQRLISALYTRLASDDLDPAYREEFERIKNWLVFEYRK